MNKVKVTLDTSGIREILKSDEVAECCKVIADKVAAMAGDGYVVEKRNYPERTGYAVRPDSDRAIGDNYNHNTLEKIRGSL